jgi:hypothetical protein
MGVEQLMYLVFMFILSVVVFSVNKHRTDYLNLMFNNKDLPVVNDKKVGKHVLAKVKLYGLKLDENGKIDREDDHYKLVGGLINKKWTFELNGNQEIDVIKPDFRLSENREDFLDIIATYTNFDLRRFVFKGDDKHKLFSLDMPVINSMKDHADYIIDEIFKDMCAVIEEEGLFADVELG